MERGLVSNRKSIVIDRFLSTMPTFKNRNKTKFETKNEFEFRKFKNSNSFLICL